MSINWRQLAISVLAVLLAFVVGAVLIVVSNPDIASTYAYFFGRPGDALGASWEAISESYGALFSGAFGNWDAISETLVQSSPLICAGLGVTVAFRAGLFNIGAQGQIIIAAACAGFVGFGLQLPPVIHVLAAVLAGIVGGAVWGGIVGLLKARTGAHEVICTIMMNWVAYYILSWLLTTKAFQAPGRSDPISSKVDDTATYLPLGGTTFNIGFFVALLAVAGVWWLLNRSTMGFELRAVGANPDASQTAGMSVGKAYVMAMVLAGALAGLAGTQQVLGAHLPITSGVAGTFGFDAITVALLGRGTPVGTLFAGLLFGALAAGGTQMQAAAGTPLTLMTVLQATIVLFVAAPALIQAVFRIRTNGAGALTEGTKA